GVGPSRSMLESLARELLPEGQYIFLGHVPDAADLYASADLFALPSMQEGFGLVFVEAGLAGVASIGSEVGGVPEVIVNGRTGLLVPCGDTPALSGAIQRLLQDSPTREAYGRA